MLVLCRADYYRWLDHSFTANQVDEAWLANAIFDADHEPLPELLCHLNARQSQLSPRSVGILVRLVEAGGWLDRDRLLMDLWGDDADPARVRSLETLVSSIRLLLGRSSIEYRSGLYRLGSVRVELDVQRFRSLSVQALEFFERGDRSMAGIAARGALELWRGEPVIARLGTGTWIDEMDTQLRRTLRDVTEIVAREISHRPSSVRYVELGEQHLAWSAFGRGEPDLVLLGGWPLTSKDARTSRVSLSG